MLVLSRKRNERIVIGGTIELVVVAIEGNQVKLGFNAPANVRINRAEIQDKIEASIYDRHRSQLVVSALPRSAEEQAVSLS